MLLLFINNDKIEHILRITLRALKIIKIKFITTFKLKW